MFASAKNAFAELQAQSQGLNQRRQHTAGQHYEAGLKYFDVAVQSQFQDKQALQQALQEWIQAIRHNRRDPAPCVAVGFLFILLGEQRQALLYLKAAQQIDPQHADAARFLELLQRPPQASMGTSQAVAVAASVVPPTEDPDLDYDSLYDQTEALIQQQIAALTAAPPPVAGTDKQSYQALKLQYQQLKTSQDLIHSQLGTLEQEIDCHDLRQRLSPIEKRLQHFADILLASQAFASLAKDLKSETQQVQDFLAGDVHAAPLEHLLDRCDELADALEALEQQGHQIRELEGFYQQLTHALEKLQDRLDEVA